jgi:tetraacyldisaccharide 4'-kinase
MQVRNLLYEYGWLTSYDISIPIISVGNLSVGGTGKTPMACYIIDLLLQQGLKVGYLSRGYGRDTTGYRKVVSHMDGSRIFGDESVLIANRFPQIAVSVCEDRIAGANRMIQEDHVQVLVLDDAFQHRRIRRDVDIVMIDATRMPDRDLPLPAGNLRETTASLSRAHLVVVNKLPNGSDIEAYQKRLSHTHISFSKSIFTKVVFFNNENQISILPQDINSRPMIAFAGLGNNHQFFQQLEASGVKVLKSFSFPDHHRYTDEDLKMITLEFRRCVPEWPNLMIITTEKDYCRLNSVNLPAALTIYPCAYIQMELHWIAGEQQVQHSILKALKDDRKRTV